MFLGPVEIVCIQFPRTFIQDEIVAALRARVECSCRHSSSLKPFAFNAIDAARTAQRGRCPNGS
jgi:hypothetical protein